MDEEQETENNDLTAVKSLRFLLQEALRKPTENLFDIMKLQTVSGSE